MPTRFPSFARRVVAELAENYAFEDATAARLRPSRRHSTQTPAESPSPRSPS